MYLCFELPLVEWSVMSPAHPLKWKFCVFIYFWNRATDFVSSSRTTWTGSPSWTNYCSTKQYFLSRLQGRNPVNASLFTCTEVMFRIARMRKLCRNTKARLYLLGFGRLRFPSHRNLCRQMQARRVYRNWKPSPVALFCAYCRKYSKLKVCQCFRRMLFSKLVDRSNEPAWLLYSCVMSETLEIDSV